MSVIVWPLPLLKSQPAVKVQKFTYLPLFLMLLYFVMLQFALCRYDGIKKIRQVWATNGELIFYHLGTSKNYIFSKRFD